MTFRDEMNELADDVRSLMGPDEFDVCPTSVTVITRTWAGGFRGKGDYNDSTPLPLPPYTPVRHITEHEIASSGGRYEASDVVIGAIPPQYTAFDGTVHGFTEDQLRGGTAGQGIEVIFQLAQQSGATGINGNYTLRDFRRDRSHRFEIVAMRSLTTP